MERHHREARALTTNSYITELQEGQRLCQSPSEFFAECASVYLRPQVLQGQVIYRGDLERYNPRVAKLMGQIFSERLPCALRQGTFQKAVEVSARALARVQQGEWGSVSKAQYLLMHGMMARAPDLLDGADRELEGITEADVTLELKNLKKCVASSREWLKQRSTQPS